MASSGPSPSRNPNIQHFVGYVETTTDALRLIMAARQGIIPRITRRLNDSERRSMIKSGSVFVFCVEESGIKRWTEGLSWSPSRIIGNFLVYREVTERATSRGAERGLSTPGTSTFQVAAPSSSHQRYRSRSEAGIGRSVDTISTMRPNGLIKKTITVKVEGTDHHLISYYRDEDVRLGHLHRPIARADIMALTIPPEMVRATNFRHPPHIEIGADGRAHIFDAEETDSSRRQQDRTSSSSSSPTSYTSTSPTPHYVSTGHAAQADLHSPVHSSSAGRALQDHVSDGYGEVPSGAYPRLPATHRSSTPVDVAYRWPATPSLPSPIPAPSRQGGSHAIRSPVQWQQRTYEHNDTTPSYPLHSPYYQISPGREQSPAPMSPHQPPASSRSMFYAQPAAGEALPGDAHRLNGWSAPASAALYPHEPHSPTAGAYHADERSGLPGERLSSSAASHTNGWSPAQVLPQQNGSPYMARRTPSRHGTRHTYYPHGSQAYVEEDGESMYHGEASR